MTKTITLEAMAYARNNEIATENRAFFKKNNLTVMNLISSPGSGKTRLMEALGAQLGKKLAVITGDIQTTLDADRITKAGAVGVQIETGGNCHLTADMIRQSLKTMDVSHTEFLIIENVGNLVCPSTYDLGEAAKVAIVALTEGDEKPVKYPELFTRASVVLINKMDLAPYLDFDIQRAETDCRMLNPSVKIIKTSCKTGTGISEFIHYMNTLRSTS